MIVVVGKKYLLFIISLIEHMVNMVWFECQS